MDWCGVSWWAGGLVWCELVGRWTGVVGMWCEAVSSGGLVWCELVGRWTGVV